MALGDHHGWIYSMNYPRIESFIGYINSLPHDIQNPWIRVSIGDGVWFDNKEFEQRNVASAKPPKEYLLQHLLLGE